MPGTEERRATPRGEAPFAGDGPRTTITRGHFGFDHRFDHRLSGDLDGGAIAVGRHRVDSRRGYFQIGLPDPGRP
jgi:hypothetical protein